MKTHTKFWTMFWFIVYSVLAIGMIIVGVYHILFTNTILGIFYIVFSLSFVISAITFFLQYKREQFLDIQAELDYEINKRVEHLKEKDNRGKGPMDQINNE